MDCRPSTGAPDEDQTLQDLMARYRREYLSKEATVRVAYKNLKSDGDACEHAARLLVPRSSKLGWKRHGHFHRGWLYSIEFIGTLDSAAEILRAYQRSIKTAAERGFDAVHKRVSELLRHLPGLGPLAFYDITSLLGHRFDFYPTAVYLHAGTLAGARVLFGSSQVGSNSQLTPAQQRRLRPLKAHEIEDFLCIYKSQIESLKRQGKLPEWSYA